MPEPTWIDRLSPGTFSQMITDAAAAVAAEDEAPPTPYGVPDDLLSLSHHDLVEWAEDTVGRLNDALLVAHRARYDPERQRSMMLDDLHRQVEGDRRQILEMSEQLERVTLSNRLRGRRAARERMRRASVEGQRDWADQEILRLRLLIASVSDDLKAEIRRDDRAAVMNQVYRSITRLDQERTPRNSGGTPQHIGPAIPAAPEPPD